MIVVQRDTLEFIETPGANAGAAVATPRRGAREVSVIRQRQEPGGFNPPHTHDREEVMVMVTGEVTVTVGEETTVAAGGDTVIVPAGASHRIANEGSVPAEWLLIAPAGVRFFHANGEPASPPWSR